MNEQFPSQEVTKEDFVAQKFQEILPPSRNVGNELHSAQELLENIRQGK